MNKLLRKTKRAFVASLVFVCILALGSPVLADVGLTVKTPMVTANQNIIYGDAKGSALGNLLLLQSNDTINKFTVDLSGNVTAAGKINNLTLTSNATGFSIAGGTAVKTLTLTGDATISGNPLSNPMTTLGDIIYGGAAGASTRLAGASGVLHSTGGAAPTWGSVNLASDVGATILPGANGGTGIANSGKTLTLGGNFSTTGAFTSTGATSLAFSNSAVLTVTANATISGTPLSNPMSAVGDIIYGGASGAPTKLVGATGVLHSTGAAAPTWGSVNLASDVGATILPGANGGTGIANSGKTITLGGNLTTAGAFATTLTVTAATNATLPAGTVTLEANPMTAQGDMVWGSTATNPSVAGRIAAGTAGQYLKSNGAAAAPSWSAVSVTETDPKVGALSSNYVPKWNGSTNLVNSLIYDNGTGVGVNTASPTGQFDVEGNISGSWGGYIRNIHSNGAGLYVYSGNNGTQQALQVGSAGNANIIYARADGNVGIGTSAPGYQLDVESAGTAVYGKSSGYQLAGVYGNNTNASNGYGVFGNNTTGTGYGVYGNSTGCSYAVYGKATMANSCAGNGVTGETDAGTGVVGTATTGTGLVGNTNSGYAGIQASNGSGHAAGVFTSGSGEGLDVYNSSLTNPTINVTNYLGGVGINVQDNYGNGWYTGWAAYLMGRGYLGDSSWNYGSDRRLKENIKYFDDTGLNALSYISQLRPASFDYISGVKNETGFIAQDVQTVLPDLVTVDDKGMLGLKTDNLIPYLVKGMQEQQAQIETLQKDNQTLQTEIDALNSRSGK